MARLTHKRLKQIVHEVNLNECKDLPYGYILGDETLYVLRRKGGDKVRVASGSTHDLHVVLTALLRLDKDKFYDVIRAEK